MSDSDHLHFMQRPYRVILPLNLAAILMIVVVAALEVCVAENILCVDLAESMNGNTDLFYDDLHFNEAGSNHAAEVIWSALRDQIPDK